MSPRARLTVFALTFCGLYLLLQLAGGFERWFIESLTVPVAAWAVGLLGLADGPVQAIGSRIVTPGGGLNVLQGCEGLDVLGLWVAAVAAGPFSWRGRWLGWTLGTLLVFGLNQARLLSLFDLYRSNRDLFGDAHGLWWPLALVVAVFVMFMLWQRLFPGPAVDTPASPHAAA
jgi:exosortase/archaeosortase family protein